MMMTLLLRTQKKKIETNFNLIAFAVTRMSDDTDWLGSIASPGSAFSQDTSSIPRHSISSELLPTLGW